MPPVGRTRCLYGPALFGKPVAVAVAAATPVATLHYYIEAGKAAEAEGE
jgi:hypothetical protein